MAERLSNIFMKIKNKTIYDLVCLFLILLIFSIFSIYIKKKRFMIKDYLFNYILRDSCINLNRVIVKCLGPHIFFLFLFFG